MYKINKERLLMDYETFFKFFDTVAEEKRITIGDYIVEYGNDGKNVGLSHDKINYYRDGYKLGRDYINEYFVPGSIMPKVETSYESGDIKNFDKLIDYLDYLYNTNIDRLVEEERQREQRRIESFREEERKQKKVDDFINLI